MAGTDPAAAYVPVFAAGSFQRDRDGYDERMGDIYSDCHSFYHGKYPDHRTACCLLLVQGEDEAQAGAGEDEYPGSEMSENNIKQNRDSRQSCP